MMEDLKLDGNAAGGLLAEIFVHEMTAARSTCAGCGAIEPVGVLSVYVHAPGLVIRCPHCDQVLIRVVHGRDRYWLDLTGVRCLEFGAAS